MLAVSLSVPSLCPEIYFTGKLQKISRLHLSRLAAREKIVG
jgi:hypothetical protein